MKGKWTISGIILAVLLLALAAGLTWAQGPEPPGEGVQPQGGVDSQDAASAPLSASLGAAPSAALGTGFTYQGQLKQDGNPVNGTCDFQFSLWDAAGSGSPPTGGNQIGSPQTKTGISVSNGYFTIPDLDFGADAFTGDARYLEIAVRCPAGSGSYTTLSPRQQLTPTPYALAVPGLMGTRNPLQIALLRWYEANTTGMSLTVGAFPDQLAFDGEHMWVTNWGPDTVTKFRAGDGAIIGVYPAGSNPNPIAFDGYHIWVGAEDSPLVTKIRASDGTTVASFNAGTSGHWGMAFDGANIWVTNTGSNSVTKIRARDNAILGTYTTGDRPNGVAFDGTHIWVMNADSNTVTKLRASDGALVGNYAVPHGLWGYGVVFDGTNIWVTTAGDTVTKIRASDGAILGTYSAGIWPAFLAFDGAHIWVTNYNYPCPGPGTVTKLRASDGALVGSYTVGRCPLGITFDGANVWVANSYSHTVSKH